MRTRLGLKVAAGFFAAALSCAHARTAEGDPFRNGVDLYQQQKFAEAEGAFRQIPDPSSAVLYNLGNACFKQGKLGQAILCWERAVRLDPVDHDAATNLEMARGLLRDAVPPDNTSLPMRWLAALLFGLPAPYLRTAAMALWIAANAAFLVGLLTRTGARPLRAAAIACVTLCALAALLLALNLYRIETNSYGILVVPKESVRSGPGTQNTVLMEIHEGLKVKVLNTEGDWIAVKMAGGYSGWIPKQAVGII